MWPPPPGSKVSKYRLERLLGAGGMGSVYLAHDLDLERDVAIKFISAERAADESARRRLIHEARAAAGLDHPNICAVHDVVVEPDGHAFIVMQYVEGETLSARLQNGPLEPRQAFLIAADVAAALSAAHRRGIIHRDIKPQNVIVMPSGRAKLLDFGIARLDEVAAAKRHGTTLSNLTGPGHVAGTPAYMSPEQVQLLPLDGRSDLFSLGGVLFECLTGRRPFEGRSDAETYSLILQHQPPPVSELRPGLSESEDELCRRLLAKHPDDRFTSAEELLGALRVLVPDTAHASGASRSRATVRARPGKLRTLGYAMRSRTALIVAIALVVVVAGAGVWRWRAGTVLPPPPPDAERWYAIGTQAIHDGAYHSGRLALQEAINIFPKYALAYARLAEAYSELDDSASAQRALLTVDSLVPNRSRLPIDDRLRIDAVRALALQDVATAVRTYAELAARRPGDPAAWLDLGRAQEASVSLTVARASYDRSIAIDKQYAAAHLRRATTLTQEANSEEALREFDEAERLYRAASNVEGETEALLRRGTFLLAIGRTADARAALERGRTLAANLKNRPQELRARLRLSTVPAREGRLSEALQLSGTAIDEALSGGLETVAAEGLTDLTVTLLGLGRADDADAQIRRAIQLAEKGGARRLLTRARLQHAAVLVQRRRPDEALALAQRTVAGMRGHGYRQWELSGMSIMARAQEELGRYAEARTLADEVVRTARDVQDDMRVAQALDILAGAARATGALPEALAYRVQREAINRAQKNTYQLAYDLTTRAELLIRMGRAEEAERALVEIDAGIASGVDVYRQRARRVLLLRAWGATLSHNFDASVRTAASLIESGSVTDASTQQAAALRAYAEAHAGRRPSLPQLAPTASGESLYWALAARLSAGDAKTVLAAAGAELGKPSATVSCEYEWRMAALAAAAAKRAGAADRSQELAARAQQALDRLRDAWKEDARLYAAIPHVAELIREAGLRPPS